MQVAVASVFIGAVALQWSARLNSSGAVIFATAVTCLLFSRWLFSNPILPPAKTGHPLNGDEIAGLIKTNLVLAGAAVIFYLYALQRLMKPEAIIS